MQAEEAVLVQEEERVDTAEEAVRARAEEVRAEEIVIGRDNCFPNTEEVNNVNDATVDNNSVDGSFLTKTGNIPQIDGQTEIQKGIISNLRNSDVTFLTMYHCDMCDYYSSVEFDLRKHKKKKHKTEKITCYRKK